jgi:hypothetical protein
MAILGIRQPGYIARFKRGRVACVEKRKHAMGALCTSVRQRRSICRNRCTVSADAKIGKHMEAAQPG